MTDKKPFGLDDFKVVCDERNNPCSILSEECFNINVYVKPWYAVEITLNKQGQVVAINGHKVLDKLYGEFAEGTA